MKFILSLLLSIFAMAGFAQQNKVGFRAGFIDPESFFEFGYNVELSLERSLEKAERVSFAIQLGTGKQNDFPDYFRRDFRFAENNDVSQVVDDRIRALTIEEYFAEGFGFGSYDVNYLRVLVKYKFLRVLGWDVKAFSGLFLRDESIADFSLYQTSFFNNRIADYRSNYRVEYNLVVGWPLGLEIEKQIGRDWSFSADALYGIPFNRVDDRYVNLYGRVGINYLF